MAENVSSVEVASKEKWRRYLRNVHSVEVAESVTILVIIVYVRRLEAWASMEAVMAWSC